MKNHHNSEITQQALRALTLIELLVVIAIIAGMLLPTLGKAKTKAQGIHFPKRTVAADS